MKYQQNGQATALANLSPDFYDWYETVKINYGIRPDGSKDFPELPAGYDQKSYQEHFAYWQDKDVPNSWKKFRDIALYWLDKGVDGFRFDMAEMVPVEFWSFMNSSIKMKNPNALLLAEVYNPYEYRNYIRLGKMDYLYDKVELYDTLKNIIHGHGSTDHLVNIQNGLADIEHHMLHFLENHDEQRVASPEFAGDPRKAAPAMVISATNKHFAYDDLFWTRSRRNGCRKCRIWLALAHHYLRLFWRSGSSTLGKRWQIRWRTAY